MTHAPSEKLTRLFRPEVRALTAYQVPDARGLIKLDAMENPYTWPEALKAAWLETLAKVEVNRYPDPTAAALKARLRDALQVPPTAEILFGNGSDELIQVLLLALARPGAVALAPTPTFVMYELIARWTGVRFVGVPLKPDFALDRAATCSTSATSKQFWRTRPDWWCSMRRTMRSRRRASSIGWCTTTTCW
jgi:histidinol-phosphate aminotransferase